MSIYHSTKVMPYVYRLDNPITGEFYIGYREANTITSNLDLPEYKTSAPKVKENFNTFDWHILAEFFDGDSAYDFEQLSIFENWNNPLLLNEACFHNMKRFKNYGHQHTDITKQLMRKPKSKSHARNIAKAKTNMPHFGGRKSKTYVTPFGTFISLKTATEITNICFRTIIDRCSKNVDIEIKYHRSLKDKSIIGKTWRELGWYTI